MQFNTFCKSMLYMAYLIQYNLLLRKAISNNYIILYKKNNNNFITLKEVLYENKDCTKGRKMILIDDDNVGEKNLFY